MRRADKIMMAVYIAVAALAMAMMMTGCRQVKVVTEYKEVMVHDTLHRVDSVWQDRIHKEYVKGDTVKITDSVFINNYKYIYKNVEVERVDSVPYPVEVKVPGPVRNSSFAKFCETFFILMMLIALAIIAYWIWRRR